MTWQPFTTIGLNQWLVLELLHPVQYPSYCTNYVDTVSPALLKLKAMPLSDDSCI